ncbi:hypothetical protein J2S70_000306 [Trueperella bonasi]|uniref:RDD family protein n=1 Tax=Trueperella bonasi TaxID=312286 RepID=A0ABT9NEE3_9ACTO|nr:hypothetical protein [Trueperella bonasi]MDP9805724.1 hypothetical protein [Trueperella bonasi]
MILATIAVYVLSGLGAVSGNKLIRSFLQRIDQPKGERRLTLLSAQKALPGGRWIGILERLATYICVVTGFPAGIAFVLAVKGLGRYPELKNDSSARVGELFIIGTFASILWALMWAGIAIRATAILSSQQGC